MSIIINSETVISSIETPFKVAAGPGAGKTRWLIGHIKNVLHLSDRLGICKKVACITYTNVAAETIIKRLGDSATQVEVSTIHSFLYTNVVKPYVNFIASDYKLDVNKIEGHDDSVLTNYNFLKEWKQITNQLYLRDDEELANIFKQLRWILNGNKLELKSKYPPKVGGMNLRSGSLITYKEMMWTRGYLHHDDVLFFSYNLFQKFPFLLTVIRAKFPYFFIDEFQDTSPIQKTILEQIGSQTTIIGIIGDKAQSIYGFQGANSDYFDTFFPPITPTYIIEDNWRSTENIVNLLNNIRKDIKQRSKRGLPGTQPMIFVGYKVLALARAKDICGTNNIHCLSRDNLTTISLMKGLGQTPSNDLIEELQTKDTSSERVRTIISYIEAIEYAKQGYFKDAIKKLKKLKNVIQAQDPKKRALEVLQRLLQKESEFRNKKLIELYNYIQQSSLASLPTFRGANPKSFYETITYLEVSTAVKNLNESGLHRTIHKSKGDEFDNVLVVFDKDEKGNYDEKMQLDFLLTPDLDKEEQRIKYVAVSRAKNNLFIVVPELSNTAEQKLNSLGIGIERL